MRNRSTLILAATLLVGCAADEPDVSQTESYATAANKIALNKIALNKIALNKIALNKIALNKIALNKIALNSLTTGNLINSPDCTATSQPDDDCGGRLVLEYLIGCAFPDTVTLVGTADDGTTYEFHGSIGLAPRWETRRLTLKEQRWISACMLARVSNSGVPLLISLRGPHDALAVTAQEQNDFVHEEGAYYGDIFADDQRFYACQGEDLYSGNIDQLAQLRACALPLGSGDTTICGMTYAGECGAFNVERTCDTQTDDYYERCHACPSKNGKFHNEGIENRFEEVITVWVPETPIFP